MQKARFVAFWAVALTAALALPAHAADAPFPATLTVVGQGTVSPPPDRAVVAFQITTTDAQSAVATSENARIADALTAAMAKLGLPSSAVATTGYALTYYPRPSKPDPTNDQRYGFTTERTMAVTVDATDKAGAVVDAGVAAGATNVNGVTFMLKDPQAALRSAQTVAFDDAAAQARTLAGTAGVRLVRILSIAPSGGGGPQPLQTRMLMSVASAPAPTTIAPGTLTVTATVTVRYEIAPAKPI